MLGKDGQRRNLRVTTVAGDYIEGETARGQTVRIEFTDMEELYWRDLQRGRMAAPIAGGVLLILFALDDNEQECFNPFVIEGC